MLVQRVLFMAWFVVTAGCVLAQTDSVFLMNGHIFSAQIMDTSAHTVKLYNAQKPTKPLEYGADQLYRIRFANGSEHYYYQKDSVIGNWLTQSEMWLYMKGEQDARKGFKAKGAMIGALCAGLIGGMTGTFWGPVFPYGFMALSGLPKIRISHATVRDEALLQSNAYLMGYERVARQKIKLRSLLVGTMGLLGGYGIYALAHGYYPETVNIGINH
jgi:hypothetical protein